MSTLLADIGVEILIVVMVAWSLDLVVGDVGLVSVMHAGLVGAGAYGFALVIADASVGWGWGYLAAAGLGTLVGGVSGLLTSKLRGDYFVLVSLGLQVVITEILLGWRSVTGGALGVAGIRQLELGGLSLQEPARFLVSLLPLVVLTGFVSKRVRRSFFGLVLHCMREDEDVVDATGRSVGRRRWQAFAVSGLAAGLAGAATAQYYGYIEPSMFDIRKSVFFLVVIIFGGISSMRGAVVGAAAIVVLGEVLRVLPLESGQVAFLRQMVYGALLVGVLRWRPTGLFGNFDLWEAKR